MKRVVWSTLSDEERKNILRRPASVEDTRIRAAAQEIVDEVRKDGDVAVRGFTRKFDNVDLPGLAVPLEEITASGSKIDGDAIRAINHAYDNIYKFHEGQTLRPVEVETVLGVACTRRVRPIGAVGLYVPGGSAPLVSTALMLGVPSKIAENPVRVLCTPCGTDGHVNPHILYAASLCGIEQVFRIGGAQAIAAMAYGTESVPKVDKIFGPGNAYVTAAKNIVSEDGMGAALDLPAGPSEVCVIVDEKSDPAYAAADLLAQAEHDALSQVVLIALSEDMARQVEAKVKQFLTSMTRADIAKQAIANSLAIVASSAEEAIEISNLYAPEHLILCYKYAEKHLDLVTSAGSVFVGPWTPESAGDYCSGTNHVLPTYGHARACSGLGVEAFQKTITFQTITREGLAALAPTITSLAELEGLDAHARSVTIRTETPSS